MARRGNGAGRGGPARGDGWGGPANGPGWGAPARGIGHNSETAAPFEPGNQAAAGNHSLHRHKRSEELLEALFDLALNAKDEMVQVRAATAYLDRVEEAPKPMKP